MVKVPIGKIEKGLVDKTKQYKELTGIGTVELIKNLLTIPIFPFLFSHFTKLISFFISS